MAWWTSLTSGLGSFLVNPGIFLAGALLVSVPIIIHLLNRRKFKIVDWAAMDFLLEADKKNRRRVRLENLLLLLLRCLAVLLLGLLLARPFDSSGIASKLFKAQQFERIILLDDSLSMKARANNQTVMEVAREQVTALLQSFAAEQSDNMLTLFLTSNPEQPKFNGSPLDSQHIDDILDDVKDLEATDTPAQFVPALLKLENYLETQPANVNRVVYVISDLRRKDWQPTTEEAEQESQPLEILRKIAKTANACFVHDVASDEDRNVVIREVLPEKTLVAGVESRFDVLVENTGSRELTNLKLKFSAGDAVPVERDIDQLAAGETASLRFPFTFAVEETPENEEAIVHQSRKVKVEVQAERGGEEDRLLEDSVAYVAARVIPGIPTLIVDGDPSASFGKSESFYLRRALKPPGATPSGVVPEVITENELETLELSKYQVVFLCNLYRLSDKPHEELKKWVAAGGGLVILPGQQVDEEYFNRQLFGEGDTEGRELSPVRLENILGDEDEKNWSNFKIEDVQHPAFKDFAGQQNPLLNNVKIFRWWKLNAKTLPNIPPAQILAKLSDVEESPAFVERPFGRGRVLVTALPADADWSTWTSDPSYILLMQELVRYLTIGDSREGMLRVGEPLRKTIELTQYELDAELATPGEKKTHLQAVQASEAEPNRWLLEQKQVLQQGFYELKLAKRTGGAEAWLFAANLDPLEGNLQRANTSELEKQLREAGVELLASGAGAIGGKAAQLEIWKYLLWLLIALLLGEQVLGWIFGMRRA
jgi:Aerotolerance regulator N-terminal/von Willebrand factor type A domain/CARDB